jgi:cytochrome P450/NADPH-cytochrome P450 reductase
LALTLILQNFDIRLADPNYELRIVTTLTIKPGGLFIKARLRNDINPISLLKNLHGGSGVTTNHSVTKQARSETPTLDPTIGEPVTILFGSSSGTSEGLAQTLAASARRRGLKPIVQSLDAAVDNVPINQPVIIIGCTYEGQPPDNAKIFCEWIKNADPAKLSSVRFALFGCGHKGWASTYQRIPRLISEQLVAKGATMLVECGETDVSQGTISDDFDSWTETLWPTICANPTHDDSSEALDLTLSTTSRASHLHYSIREAQVLTNDRITHPDTAEKRHISLQLPPDMTYEVGDYLAVLPLNSAKTVARVLRRFALPWDTMMTLSPNSTHATIPTAHELPVATVLAGYVELSRPATRKHKSTLARYAGGALTTDARGDSCIDILERHPTIPIPFATFLAMLPPLRLRQYSISSSPRASSSSLATITFSVIGAATTYLKTLDPGSTVQVTIQKSPAHFRLPASDDDDTAPLILVATGTGLAPFRAFLQDRALRRAAAGHRPVGPAAAALLFIGCRHPDHDRLFGDDLARWEASGLVRVFPAYSRAPERAEGCRYVQDRLWRERDLVAREFDRGARAYVCGGSAVGKAVTDVAVRILRAKSEEVGKPMTADEAERCWEAWRGERYAVDVFD